MRRFVSAISLSIIFGLIVSWLERAVPLFNLGSFNAIDVTFLFFLIALLTILLLATFSGNLISAVVSVLIFAISYLAVCFYLGVQINFYLIVRLGIILISGIWFSLFLYPARSVISRYSKKVKVKQDLAFPLIFFFASILFALTVTLMEQNVIAFNITKIFYGYLYFLVSVLLLFSFFSFNEVAGFLIGVFSLPVYFLAMRLVKNNFDFKFLILNEKEFLIIVAIYSLIFAFSTTLMARSGRLFANGIKVSLEAKHLKTHPVEKVELKDKNSSEESIKNRKEPKKSILSSSDKGNSKESIAEDSPKTEKSTEKTDANAPKSKAEDKFGETKSID